jgi:fructuronate reductase
LRLNPENVGRLPPEVARLGYDRDAQACGVLHLGLGAFHRAHQAVYCDDAMSAGDRNWAITGVSLRSPAVRDELAPQGGLYTVTERGGGGEQTRLIGAITRTLVAPEDPRTVVQAIAAASVQVVTLTVTEKGYYAGPGGGLDGAAPPVAADLAATEAPQTIHGYLAAALADRRAAGAPGLTVISCDNLADNGELLGGLLGEFLERRDPSLALWTRDHCRFPSTMVDRIVPAPTAEDRRHIADQLGMQDDAAVVTEPFRQWAIQDNFAGPRPRWEAGGAQIVADVRAYETAKLRMLNGAHSALAYLGLFKGYEFVDQAIGDPAIRALVDRLMRDEAAASLRPAAGQNLGAYADALLTRFANPALHHALSQIAMDGSVKIPQRWLTTLKVQQKSGRRCPAILEALAAWIRYVRGDRFEVRDPMADRLAGLWRANGEAGIVAALFGAGGLFADHWRATPEDQAALAEAVAAIGQQR